MQMRANSSGINWGMTQLLLMRKPIARTFLLVHRPMRILYSTGSIRERKVSLISGCECLHIAFQQFCAEVFKYNIFSFSGHIRSVSYFRLPTVLYCIISVISHFGTKRLESRKWKPENQIPDKPLLMQLKPLYVKTKVMNAVPLL